jgi:aspartyl-tRNA(Asn)/glutamyl-tRNA(Gln) amidotransferase subunit A
MTIPAHASLEELGRQLNQGVFSALELADVYLDRIARADGVMHAYVSVDPESVRMQAQAADLRRRAGHALGPLDGLPIALKDLCEIEGHPASCGSAAWRDRRGAVTSTVVRRLRAAGMVILGHTHMVELAFGGWGTNTSLGTPRNPWDLKDHRIPGGSSSGSGVAVAAGLAPASIGSDTGGSVRIPASLVGITGLKTTVGLISRYGAMPLSTTLDSIGPMTRNVADAALLTAALAGPDPGDAVTLHAPLPGYDAALRATGDLAGMRVVFLSPDDYPVPVQPAVLQATMQAREVFRSLGATILDRKLPFDFADLMRRNGQIISAEAWRAYGSLARDPASPISAPLRTRLLAGSSVSGADYIDAMEHHRQTRAAWRAWMGDADALLAPTLPIAACRVDEVDEGATPLSMFTRPGNYLGTCGLALPAGFTQDKLPVGVQLLAKPFDEAVLIRLGCAFQRATDWHARTPDLGGLL